jgi:hypothetical protein|tara:strand:- start:183 stop:356 length:174 start_codon:yes stop_codon:yes gene_type:complete
MSEKKKEKNKQRRGVKKERDQKRRRDRNNKYSFVVNFQQQEDVDKPTEMEAETAIKI